GGWAVSARLPRHPRLRVRTCSHYRRTAAVPTTRPRRCSPRRDRVPGMINRVLLLSWEYPPVIEGGLARHVRKLAEGLVRQGVAVDVLTRAVSDRSDIGEVDGSANGGVSVHRVGEPSWPRDLDRFVAWVQRMNDDMLAAGESLGEEHAYAVVHGHDWLVAHASAAPAPPLRGPHRAHNHAHPAGRPGAPWQ